MKLTLGTWDRVSFFLWKWGRLACDESIAAATDRAQKAAAELAQLASAHPRVLCVGHGTFNAMVATALLRRGWCGPVRVDDDYWGRSAYR